LNRVVFISFQGIRNSVPYGMVKGVIPFFISIRQKTEFNVIYYVSRVHKSTLKEPIYEISKLYKYLLLFIAVVNKYILKIPGYKIRLIQEILFDYFAARKIKKGDVIVSTAFLYRTLKKNKDIGGKSILLAGNPDDYMIYKILKNEQSKFNFKFNDAYTYRKRIAFGLKSTCLFDHIICFTSSSYDSFIKRIEPGKLSFVSNHIIPNAEVFEKIKTKRNDIFTVCYVGFSVWLKGIVYLLEAWEKLNLPDAKLKIGGQINPDVKTYIENRFINLKNVEYLGFIKDLNSFYRNSNLFVCPSLLDAGPTTIAEAMCCGLPVIVTEGCGAKDFVTEGTNGFIIRERDSIAMSGKLLWCFENRKQLKKMGENAKNTIKNLPDVSNVSEYIVEVIQRMTQSK